MSTFTHVIEEETFYQFSSNIDHHDPVQQVFYITFIAGNHYMITYHKFSLFRLCMYRLVMIIIDLSETVHFAHWKSETTSETIFFLTVFFSDKKYFSQTEFCPRLDFV